MAAKLTLKKGLSLASTKLHKRLRTQSVKAKTRRRGGDHDGVKESDGGASVSRYTKLNKGPKKAKNRVFDTHILKEIRSELRTGDSGGMSAFFVSYWDYTDIGSMIQRLYDLLPAASLPTAPATTSVGENQLRPYLMSARAKFNFSNMSNGGHWITIYDIHCKDSTDRGPVEEWYKGVVNEEGEGDQVGGALRASNLFTHGSSPLQSKRFKRTWKVDKTTKVFLRPGEQHVHMVNHGPHKAWDNSYLRSYNNQVLGVQAPLNYIGGVTRAVLWVQSGNVCVDRLAGNVFSGVSTAATEVALIYDIAYKYSMLRNPQTTIQNVGDLGPVSGQPTFINEDSSAVVGNTFA